MTTRHRNQTPEASIRHYRSRIARLKQSLNYCKPFERDAIQLKINESEQFLCCLDDIRIDMERVSKRDAKKMLKQMLAKL